MKKECDILFLDGTEDRIDAQYSSFITYLFSIGSVLNEFGYSYKIMNITLLPDYSLNGIINELQKIKFKCIGMTTNSDNILNVIKIANAIKREFKECSIILGGSQVSYADSEVLKRCNCDIIIRNEGEYILVKLLDYYIKRKGRLETINNLTYKKNNQIIRTESEKTFVDLSNLPLPHYQILVDRFYWHIPAELTETEINSFFKFVKIKNNFILLSRGCPYNCIFCVEGNLNRKYRQLNVDRAILYIEHFLKTTKSGNINIADSTLTTSPSRIKELCNKIKKLQKHYKFRWYAEGRVNVLAKDPELIGIMYDAGLYCLQIGIESGSNKILQIQQKQITKEQMRIVAEEVGKYNGLMLTGHIIMGNPGETKSTLSETIAFIKELFILTNFNFDIRFGYLVPYVGTPIRERPEDFGLKIIIDEFEYKKVKGYNDVIIKPNELSLEEIENIYFEIRQELSAFFQNNVFKLPKNRFDNLMLFYKELEKEGMNILDNQWINSLYSLIYIQKYYYVYNQRTTFKNISNLSESIDMVFPLRLRNFEYISNSEHNFFSIKGEEIQLNERDIYLWEMADGKHTINEIFNNSKIHFGYDSLKADYIIKFYLKMYDNFILVFKEV